MKKILIFCGAAISLILGITAIFTISTLNYYQSTGEMRVRGFDEKVEVRRDEKGMAYIQGETHLDVFRAQGFVAAQDRLFQMEQSRRAAAGRISELLGERAIGFDRQMRTIGLRRNAIKHAALLDDETRAVFEAYADGVNEYIAHHPKDHPLEIRKIGFELEPWTPTDSLSILYLMGWNSAANLRQEIVNHLLIEELGEGRAREIFSININPDDISASPKNAFSAIATRKKQIPPNVSSAPASGSDAIHDEQLMAFFDHAARDWEVGSNNWTVGPIASPNGAPILSNDPHLDATTLPGPLYPIGLAGPDFRVVGAGIAGIPGMVIGRSEHVAIGATNAYGDGQDLFIESIDPNNPDNYLEGGKSIPFEKIEYSIRVKDTRAPDGFREVPLTIKLTGRGPLVSGTLSGLEADTALSMRWSPFETMDPGIGLDALIYAKNAEDLRERLRSVTTIMLNLVYADTHGNFGWQTTGRIPIRSVGDGSAPTRVADEAENWKLWIPYEEMPHSVNPVRGWIGTANHYPITGEYPYAYTSYASPYYRYLRMSQVLDQPGVKSVDDHWALQRDTKNLMAEKLAPIMAAALAKHEDTARLAQILGEWDFIDDADAVAPTIFQSVYREFAGRVYRDELGEELSGRMLNIYYLWHVRLEQMLLEGDSAWFDNVDTTDVVETADDLFHEAAVAVVSRLSRRLTTDVDTWKWGRVHQIRFKNPVYPSGMGSDLVGGGSHPMDGSGETLYRAIYAYDKPYGINSSACLRMVADLGDDEKVVAVMPSGVSGRTLDPHYTDQVDEFMSGKKLYWWFSEEMVHKHTVASLTLNPIR